MNGSRAQICLEFSHGKFELPLNVRAVVPFYCIQSSSCILEGKGTLLVVVVESFLLQQKQQQTYIAALSAKVMQIKIRST